MASTVDTDRTYRLLQQRLDRAVTGAPDSPAFMQILRLLFSPEDADLARRLPSRPTRLEPLAQKLGMPMDALEERLTTMAERGVVLDMQYKGRRYFLLPPVVVGFFEFTFMRTRDNLPMAELARLFHQYMEQDDRFARSVFRGQTQVGRSLVREEALPPGAHAEILDWERASHVIQSASALGVGLCPCRHKLSYLGKACEAPVRVCLCMDYAAETLVRSGIAERITTDEGMKILQQCKEAGLAQTGDNIQQQVTYICNCCGCCCGMIQAIRTFNIRNAIVTSNWIMAIDNPQCKGCGKCVQACPIQAIALRNATDGKKQTATLDETLCLGCGVCYAACRSNAIQMKPRPQRTFTPETVFDRVIRMAIERGKLADLLFENPERLSHRALGRILSVLENTPPIKAAMAIKPLRSVFLNALVKRAQ